MRPSLGAGRRTGSEKSSGRTTSSEQTVSPSDNRPSLQRSSPATSRSSGQSTILAGETSGRSQRTKDGDDSSTVKSSDDDSTPKRRSLEGTSGQDSSDSPATSPSEVEIARLRAAVQSRMMSKQQRVALGQTGGLSSPPAVPGRRPSPIKEEMSSSVSPMSSAFNPTPGTTTSSTDSTSSSARTVRGSAAATPSAHPLRTPSYPFPYVPGTPRAWSSSFHQPFTVLSPTTSAGPSITPGNSTLSGASTPAGNAVPFAPPGPSANNPEDPRYPAPNLYDLTLQLNAEPGLDAWWNTVSRIMHDCFMAERVSLALPADSNDMENVPWGQKATFNAAGTDEGSDDSVDARSHMSRASSYMEEPRLPRPQIRRPRPNLESRHSYAGHTLPLREKEVAERKPAAATRPMLPSRTVSHAPFLQRHDTSSTFASQSTISELRHSSISDPDFSSVGGEHPRMPHMAVFHVLKGLDREFDGLIDASGVNKVLERGRMITLTRDYSVDQSDKTLDANARNAASAQLAQAQKAGNAYRDNQKPSSALSGHRHVFSAVESRSQRRGSLFEEYEQEPPSPWAQSPAPSPAIQGDPENNPFFTAGESVEESFNPTASPQDYSKLDAIDAIGVDIAHTVMHLPLIHPTLSPLMPSSTDDGGGETDQSGKQSSSDGERRAPIAILSILTSAVPYPLNLTRSLKLLGPHLAVSYSMAHQMTAAQNQALGIRHRRGVSGRTVNATPLFIEPSNLDELISDDLEDIPGSLSGSITSPSDYSGRSKHSPASSLAGTPGWDPATHGQSMTRSVVGTPAAFSQTEGGEGYFDRRRGGNVHRSVSGAGNSASASQLVTPAKSGRRSPVGEKGSNKKLGQDEEYHTTPRSDRKPKAHSIAKAEKSPFRQLAREQSPPRNLEVSSPRRPSLKSSTSHDPAQDPAARAHSLLHSYGADFGASFQGLPTAATPKAPTFESSHVRQSSVSETAEMPPPSERLLRTIIDSLPVQIFTAAPTTGQLTWVNSKFLVYRGQDSRQVLKEPWQAIHPDDLSGYMDQWKKSLRTGQQMQQKVRLQRFDGNYRWFYARAAPLKDRRQNIVHWIGTNMDIHDQHLAELNSAKQQETAASEAKYRALANSSPQVVFTVNRSKGVTFCNSQWLTYSGQTEAQALGLGFMEHVHPDDILKCRLPTFEEGNLQAGSIPTTMPGNNSRQGSRQNSRQSSRQGSMYDSPSLASSSGSSDTEKPMTSPAQFSPGQPLPQAKLSRLASTGILKVAKDSDGKPSYSTEVRLRTRDGEYRWHLVRVLLADTNINTAGEDDTWYGTCTDINDHKALERDLKETMDEKSRFLSNMSHEIRTPLNGITGMVNFLIDSSLSAEQMEHVNIIRASTEGLRGLINDILDLSKAEAGMIQLSMDWLHIRSLLEEVNDLTSAMAIDKGLELNYLVEANVPSQVKGDRFRIRQILLNTIGNAIKFTQTGEVFIRCSILSDAEEEPLPNEMFIQFEIIDTGRGFTDKEAQYLFKRFSQIDGSSTRQHGGTGLGLVISRQLAQLHGGDMAAKGSPGKGSTFIFFIKTTLASAEDQPPAPPPTPGVSALPITPYAPPVVDPAMSANTPRAHNTVTMRTGKASPMLAADLTQSPSPYTSSPGFGHDSPAASSASSDPSVRTSRTSTRSERSSASSFAPDTATMAPSSIKLNLPSEAEARLSKEEAGAGKGAPQASLPPSAIRMLSPGGTPSPPMYSILVVCPLKHSRQATVHHMNMTLPKNVPHQITARESLLDCQKMIGGDNPVIFSHVVLVLQSVPDITAFLDQLLSSGPHSTTQIIVITDLAQKRKIVERAPHFNYDQFTLDRRVRFIFKPLKPSKFGIIFDPQKEREMSTDRNQDSAQQVAITQKQVYEELKSRLGNKGMRVLLVEDNRVNQMVLLKFLSKVSIQVDTVQDGVQCTEKIYANPHGFYSIILCDLHMPNKDGYQTCREIRKWEKKNSYRYLPIIALSANVLGDVYSKCVDAGFNSYVTKPVDFKELSSVMLDFLDPEEPGKPIEFMRMKKK